MIQPHVSILFAGKQNHAIANLAEQIASELGFAPSSTDLETTDVSPDLVRDHARRVPLLVAFLDPLSNTINWLKEAVLGSTYLVVVGCPSLAPETVPCQKCVAVAELDPGEDAGLQILRLLAAARREFETNPAPYLPLDARTTETREPYTVLNVSKQVIISPTGHGRIDFTYEIVVRGEEFVGSSHYFGLTPEAPADAVLPPLEQLINRPLWDLSLGQGFAYRLLYSTRDETRMDIMEVQSESTSRNKVLRCIFAPRPSVNQILKYAMAWAHPSVFTVRGPDTSALRCAHNYEHLELSLMFLHERSTSVETFEPGKEPILNVYNPLEIRVAQLPSRAERLMNGTRYSWDLTSLASHTRLVAEWTRR